jgi:hypothetical protein
MFSLAFQTVVVVMEKRVVLREWKQIEKGVIKTVLLILVCEADLWGFFHLIISTHVS